MSSPYQQALLDHYHHPRNRADLADAGIVRRGRNPSCGDDLEVGVDLAGDLLRRVRFRGRACSIAIASASIMTDSVTGKSIADAGALIALMQRWFGGGDPPPAVPETLLPLSAVLGTRSRRRCALLAWEALRDALAARDPGAA